MCSVKVLCSSLIVSIGLKSKNGTHTEFFIKVGLIFDFKRNYKKVFLWISLQNEVFSTRFLINSFFSCHFSNRQSESVIFQMLKFEKKKRFFYF